MCDGKIIENVEEIGKENWNARDFNFMSLVTSYAYCLQSYKSGFPLAPQFFSFTKHDINIFLPFYNFGTNSNDFPGKLPVFIRDFLRFYYPAEIWNCISSLEGKQVPVILLILPHDDLQASIDLAQSCEKRLKSLPFLRDKEFFLTLISSHDLSDIDYTCGLQPPYSYYDINKQWTGLQDFFNSFSRKTRERIKNDYKKMAKAGVKIVPINPSRYWHEMMKMQENAGVVIDETGLRLMGQMDEYVFHGFFLDRELFQFSITIFENKKAYLFHFSSKREIAEATGSILALYTFLIEDLIKLGYERLYLGFYADESKTFRGAQIIKRFACCKTVP
jgi:hypothetical protein